MALNHPSENNDTKSAMYGINKMKERNRKGYKPVSMF